jgi:uncharacterized protein
MISPLRRTWLAVAALGLLAAAVPARAALVAEVRDEAKLFKPETLREADQVIREIKRDFKHDLLIETFPGIPDDKKAAFNKVKDNKEEKERFFQEWALGRAKTAEVNGVYILIVKQPGHVQVEVGNDTRKKAFTLKDRDKLAEIMTADFRNKEWDKGLLDSVEYVRKTMEANLGTPKRGEQPAAPPVRHPASDQPAPPSLLGGIWGLVCIALVVVAVVWVVFAIIRAISGMGRGTAPGGGYAPGYGGYGGGGGGFLTGMLGGLFGAAAGSWLYDRFFRGDGGYAGSAAHAGESPAAGPEPQDTDYSGTGGDFDGDTGDTGNGGGGGGDFGGDTGDGGGDFGGGGGDFGGGGGDF